MHQCISMYTYICIYIYTCVHIHVHIDYNDIQVQEIHANIRTPSSKYSSTTAAAKVRTVLCIHIVCVSVYLCEVARVCV